MGSQYGMQREHMTIRGCLQYTKVCQYTVKVTKKGELVTMQGMM